ncbi:MAG: winged helix DNA-binding protein [Lachnospiraceae bacterium]|nr:winged helix DNA-binding protein [Lachnospiraceae bacterium]
MSKEHQLLETVQRIYKMIDRRTTQYIQRDNPTDLTTMQAIVLQYIMVESRKRDVFNKDIENFFVVKSSSVTSMIHFLERGGYVRREDILEDGRMKRLVLTDKSRQIEDWLCGTINEYIYHTFEDFTEEEKDELQALLKKMLVKLSV